MKIRTGPDGFHVFDRSTGTNILIEEACAPRQYWSRAPRTVSIALTNACDLGCPYCYAPKYPAVLSVDVMYQWFNELEVQGCLGIGFGGGEPTLYRHLPELCQYLSQSTRMAATFTTHGHRIDDEFVARLRGNVHFIRVSMDGIGATYEALRRRSFDALVTKLELVRTLCPFGINYVVNHDTVGDLDHAIRFAERIHASEFLLLPEQPANGRPGIDATTHQYLQHWVTQYTGPVRMAVSTRGAEGLPTCDPIPNERGLRAYAHIDAAGVLKRSSYDTAGVVIKDDGILSALARLSQVQGKSNEDLDCFRIRTFNEPRHDR